MSVGPQRLAQESNVASLVLAHGERCPERLALVVPTAWTARKVTAETRLTFGELAEQVGAVRAGLERAGLRAGDRVVVMFPVSAELYVLALALLASGLVAVLIDTSMPRRRMLQAIQRSRARAIVSVDALLRHRLWLPALWGRQRYAVDGRRLGVASYSALVGSASEAGPPAPVDRSSPALITYTSGTTGRPKGANRTHHLLLAQHRALAEQFPAADDEIDMPCFPVVALHNLCSGVATVMPAVDLRAPASVDPQVVVAQICEHGVTRMTGAPAYLGRIAAHLAATGERLDSVRTVGVGGAPCSGDLGQRLREVLPDAELLTIYGSTEAEPIASASLDEVSAAEGQGYLVGQPARAATVEVVELSDPPPRLDQRGLAPFAVPQGAPGELVVRGDHVLRGYVDDPRAERRTKLRDPNGAVWHRTGDVARIDSRGRIWLLGRLPDLVSQAGRTLYPFAIEAELDRLPGIARSALVAHRRAPAGEVAIVLRADAAPTEAVQGVRDWLASHELGSLPIQVLKELPVDARHNSRIDRATLRALRQRA
ncbi:MAG: AMP-binding protein [Deltaproteobacteria bacterium]|jgi:acyl-CoA synthetase (AMP-forming)/AMP-acid ligase II|nr:AMP-binding protein [Deltaproteobacteria bacterium]MBW2536750.1 AMP-binding protein [Deltaproteobacteria bacterium]